MDTFENFMDRLKAMDDARRAEAVSKHRAQCICGGCPTYNECMREKDELLYCIDGKSPSCTFEKRGCVCPMCPVTDAIGLKKAYFCIRGTEEEQRGMQPGARLS
jgi:hypothetical protein